MPLKPTSNPPLSSNFTPKITLRFRLHPLLLPSKPNSKSPLKIHLSNSSKPLISRTLNPINLLKTLTDWADEVQEKGMRKKRHLYDHTKWVEHRSSFRHVRHVTTSLSSRVVVSLIPPVVFFTSVAVVVAGYNTVVDMGLLPGFFPILRASTLPYQLTAPALALLLVFRTEASYSRFVEGRKAWTKIIAGTNDFARQVIVNVEGDRVIKRSLLGYIMAFPVALKCHLLYGSDARQDLQNLLEADDLALVLNSKHPPYRIIQFISQSLKLLNLQDSQLHLLEPKISCFHEGLGVCEQLMGTPVPVAYTRLTSRFLVFWHLTLPVILWDDCHWIVVPATFISAASLFCIEEVGVLIEEPFHMLSLDELCKVLCSDIQDAIATETTIEAHIAAKTRKTRDTEHSHSSNGRPTSGG